MKKIAGLLLITGWALTNVVAQSTSVEDRIRAVIEEFKTSEESTWTALPATTELIGVETSGEALSVWLQFPDRFLEEQWDELLYEELLEHILGHTSDFAYQRLQLMAKNEAGEYVDLSSFNASYPEPSQFAHLNDDPLPSRKGEDGFALDGLDNLTQPRGQLSGKTIWLSAGHGWQFHRRGKDFATQRSNHYGLVEDFVTAEFVNYYLLKYLYNAGGQVWTVRERDMNSQEVIVDKSDQGNYREQGAWSKSRTKGYGGKAYRYAITKKKETATARFTPTIPASGLYWVSVRYVSGANRTVDARYRIQHAGGESVVGVNQEVHGDTWVYLGQFYFEKGRSGAVILSNQSAEVGQAVIADAVRFGGGIGKSKEPRFEEAAKYYAQFQGYPNPTNDVLTRPMYAEWELEKGSRKEQRNAIYVSIHTNGSRSDGTETYIHHARPTPGSRTLQQHIHGALIGDLRGGWQSSWRDRGRKRADFGELRGLRTMPGVLVELAFHDNPKEARDLTTPAFRQLTARAIYKGIARYYAEKDGRRAIFLPEAPSHLQARSQGTERIVLKWKAPSYGGILGDRAKGYKVYMSQHGKAFGPGIYCAKNEFIFDQLEASSTYYFRITALNEGGESFPTAVVAVKTPSSEAQQVKYLIVDGYDRLDRGLAPQIQERKPAFRPLGKVRRVFLEQMNQFDYMADHASALAQTAVAFDGASNEAVADRLISLKDYDGIDWYLGRESTNDQTLSAREQKVLRQYLDRGGKLIISGSELAYDLDHKNNGRSFYRNYLKATYRGDNAQCSRFQSGKNKSFSDLKASLANSAYGYYEVTSPDFIQPTKEAAAVLQYRNRKTAAVAYQGRFGVVNFAFPLETIGSDELRATLFQQSIDFLHRDDPKAKWAIIADIPSSTGEELVINLQGAPEGKATFRLIDKRGKALKSYNWQHYGHADKTLFLKGIPPDLYGYELELLGRRQRGFLIKE
ncbi:MAG: N-acetylmuramoyl-L-alanine amidase [Bacteroidota bacterium]